MSKRILTSLLFFLFLTSSLVLPFSAQAAPSVGFSITKDRRYVNVTFSGLKTVSKVDYTLMYDTGSRNTGVVGGFKTKKFTSKASRRQILGTCSTRRCTFHTNPRNLSLQVTFYLRSGGTTSLTKTLP